MASGAMNVMSYKFVFLVMLISGMGSLIFYYSISRMAVRNAENYKQEKGSFLSDQMLVVLVLIFALLIATYFTVRYNFRWIEGDTAILTSAIQTMDQENTLIPNGYVYGHGYAYQAFVLLIAEVTDLSILDIQTKIMAFIGMFILIPAAISFYYAISNDLIISIVSTLVILIQPDFLFAILRGSHEKLDWPLLMISIVLLLESTRHSNIKKIKYILAFYVIVFAKIATNVFFASNFIFAFLISLIIGGILWVWGKVRSNDGKNIRRLIYISLTSSVLLFSFIAYIYPPAWINLRIIPTLVDKIIVFLFSFEFQSSPYEYINYGWIDPRVYWALSSFTWMLIVLSFAEWVRGGVVLLKQGSEKAFWKIIDWFLYAGFALQIFFSIIADFSGVLSANVQIRVLPGFVIFASIILVRALKRLLSSAFFQEKIKKVVQISLTVMFGVFTSAALIKSSLEPSLSNKWMVYSDIEVTGIDWVDENFQATSVWTGVDNRVYSVYIVNSMLDSLSENDYNNWGLDIDPDIEYIFLSYRDYILFERLTDELLILNYPIIYDNGEVRIFKIKYD